MPQPHEVEDLVLRVRQAYRDSTTHLSNSRGNMNGWLDETEKVFKYAAGDQWSVEDYTAMRESRRAPVSFNKIDPYVDAVVGIAINNAQEIKFFPRGNEDAGYGEFLTDIVDYVSEEGEFEGEEVEAFRDLLLCGMGWTESFINYSENLDGDLEKVRFDPLRMRWDPSASRINLRDAKWVLAIKDFTLEELEEKYDLDQTNYSNPWDVEVDLIGYGTRIVDSGGDYERNMRHRTKPRSVEHVGVFQYKVNEVVYRIATEEGIQEISQEEHSKTKDVLQAQGLKAIRQNKEIIRQALVLGDRVLSDEIAPVQDMYSFQCLTGKLDRMSGVFYGLVRPLIGPQQWVNKFFSTMLHLISASPKGGIIAEMSAFADIRDAESKWNKSESIVLANDGAVSEQRIIPKPQTPYPTGIDRLLEITQTALKESAGISPEMMGLSENIQPGVVESQRKQASISVLAWAFNSMRIYRKLAARLTVSFIREYLADGRLVRVAGDTGEQYIPLLKDQMTVEYDVVADESPSSPNVRERTWLVLVEILPMLMQFGLPIPPEVVDYIPIPEALKQAWKQKLSPPEPSPEQQQEQEQQKQLEMRAAEAEVSDKEAAAQQKQSVAQLNAAKIEEISAKLGISQNELMLKLEELANKRDEGIDKRDIEIAKINQQTVQ